MSSYNSVELESVRTDGDKLKPNQKSGKIVIAEFNYTVPTGNLTINDTIDLVELPAGAKLVGGVYQHGAMGVGSILDIGIKGSDGSGFIDAAGTAADDPDYFIDGDNVAAAGQDTIAELAQGDLNALATIDKDCTVYATCLGAGWVATKTLQGIVKYVQQ